MLVSVHLDWRPVLDYVTVQLYFLSLLMMVLTVFRGIFNILEIRFADFHLSSLIKPRR